MTPKSPADQTARVRSVRGSPAALPDDAGGEIGMEVMVESRDQCAAAVVGASLGLT